SCLLIANGDIAYDWPGHCDERGDEGEVDEHPHGATDRVLAEEVLVHRPEWPPITADRDTRDAGEHNRDRDCQAANRFAAVPGGSDEEPSRGPERDGQPRLQEDERQLERR